MNEICPSHLLLGIFKDLLRVLCFMREYWSSAGSSVAITCGDLIYFWTLYISKECLETMLEMKPGEGVAERV